MELKDFEKELLQLDYDDLIEFFNAIEEEILKRNYEKDYEDEGK